MIASPLSIPFDSRAAGGLRSLPVLVATGLGCLDFAAGQGRGFKDPLITQGGLVVWLFGLACAGPFESRVGFFSWTHK
jgi:hypothetical protein